MFSLNFGGVNWKRVAGLGGAAGIFIVLAFVWVQSIELGKERTVTDRYLAAYQHPRLVRQAYLVRVEGPVRIVTRIVEVEGRKETTITEDRGSVVTTRTDASVSEPILPGPSRRVGGWVTGVSLQPFHVRDREGWTGWGGYSFGDRLTLCAGITGHPMASAMILWRW